MMKYAATATPNTPPTQNNIFRLGWPGVASAGGGVSGVAGAGCGMASIAVSD
jgi:hypothetical protein